MKIVGFVQGSPEWYAHRRVSRNASDASVMMGASPNISRRELVKLHATGLEREFSDYVQTHVLDKGHTVEPKLRALAEAFTGNDFYPITATTDDGYLSASFDGVSMDETALLEAKQSNTEKMQQARDGVLPAADKWQVVQQFAVCETATRCLYVIGDGTEEGSVILTIRRSEIEADIPVLMAGWQQFEADIAAYVPEQESQPAAGRAPEQLPALSVQVTGMVTASNLAEFKANALAVLGSINRELKTDEDFADAEKTVKWCQGVEDRLEATKQQVLGQTADIEAVFRTMDEVKAEARKIRLELDKLVTKAKDTRKLEIVNAGVHAVRAHYDAMNATLGAHSFQPPQTLQLIIGGTIKGLRSLSAMRDAVDAAAATLKIEASQQADKVRANIALLAKVPEDMQHLFPDRVALCASKGTSDLDNLVALRVLEHGRKVEAERERIRQEELDRIESERVAREAADAAAAVAAETPPAATPAPATPAPAPVVEQQAANTPTPAAEDTAGARIALGDICYRIAPMTVTAAGLAQLGFQPVANQRSAKLYAASDFRRICTALRNVLDQAAQTEAA